MEKLKMQTANLADEKYRKLAELFPEAVTETTNENGEIVRAIDKDVLMQEISTRVVEGREERYQFTWPDKRKAVIAANAPSTCTLRPCREESVDFDNTQNLYIEGDNLEVLKLLQENYLGKVKMIYIDPPYNTGNDFVYEDDFAETTEEYKAKSGDYDEEGNRLFQNTDSNGRFHTDWLNMIYPRLKLARNLLSEDGVIFISIDDNEIENLRKVCDEVFGDKNFVAQLVWKKKQGGGNDSSHIVAEHEYVLAFSKNINTLSLEVDKLYKTDDALYPYKDDKGEYGLITLDKASIQFSQSLVYEIQDKEGNTYWPRVVKGKQSCWRWSKKKVEAQFDELVFKNGKVYTKYYRPDGVTPRSLLIDPVYGRTESGNDDIKSLFTNNPFSYPKPVALLKHLVGIGTQKDDIVLDFFSGSGTTAHALMQLNAEDGGSRHYILVQLPEQTDEKSEAYKAGYKNICEIGEERIRRAGKKVFNELETSLKQKQGQLDFMLNAKPSKTAELFSVAEQKEMAKQAFEEAGGPQLMKEIEELEAMVKNLDTGIRVLKLDSSNMQDVFYTPEELLGNRTLLDSTEGNIKEDRTTEDLLFQVMLEFDIPLSAKVECKKIDGHEVWSVDNGYLMACFDAQITDKTITAIAKEKPYYFAMRDSSLADDSVAVNYGQIFHTYSPDTHVKVL